MYAHGLIKDVISGSIAEEVGIESGDILIDIAGICPNDVIHYLSLTDNERLTLTIRKKW